MWFNISPSKGHLKEDSAVDIYERNGTDHKASFKTSKIDLGSGSPVMRYKHAVCSASSGHIYIHGGRFGNLPLDDDVWRFDPHQNNWTQLRTTGCKPPSLQEHTLVEYNEQLYLFGGQVSASNNEQSFWKLDLATSEWQSLSVKSSKLGAHLRPTNRRGHSAVIYNNSMYIYGGFEDFRGSSNQLWEYQLANQRWELRNLSSSSANHPEPRHSHSSIVYGDSMYVYGGLSNLKPLSDLWRWSWPEKRWFKEKTRGSSPGQLHGHTAIEAFGSMFVFGGERKGRATRSLWRLNLSNMSWQKIRPKGPQPNPTTWHGAIANPLGILDEANYIVQGDPDLLLKSSREIDCNASFSNGSLRQQSSQQVADYQQPARGRPTNKSAFSNTKPFIQSVLPIRSNQLIHSKSSTSGMAAVVDKKPVPHQNHERGSKRKSRLSFLRGRSKHNERTSRSTYELKQLSNIITKSDPMRHSISVAPSNQTATFTSSANKSAGEMLVRDAGGTNAGILDELDTDIKEMFEQALSPEGAQKKHQATLEDLDGDISMSVEMTATSRSRYHTALQADDSVNDIMMRTSQRTSYAYTTPPSELNTLRGGDSSATLQSSSNADQRLHQMGATFDRRQEALSGRDADQSGFNRRSNRPKSEIVQSLIDRADARIEHLYKPFFKHQPNNADNVFDSKRLREQRSEEQQRVNLDKSKRHTIHQTMTYYNLYFAADSNSTSNQTDGATPSSQMVRDDNSSSTIKGSDRLNATNGAIVGVHLDQDSSQMSFDGATSSSNSRTLCANSANLNLPDTSDVTYDAHNSTNDFGAPSSIQNALTVRRDTETSCDNTSLSFSAIAEFEEDDMLQCSNPADLMIGNYETSPKTIISKEEPREEVMMAPEKSASSGYDSISGFEQAGDDKDRSSSQQVTASSVGYQATRSSSSNPNTQEESSVRTGSSIGNDLCITTSDASPEQSALKKSKRKNRYWQLCMFVIGGKQGGANSTNEPITIWRLYI